MGAISLAETWYVLQSKPRKEFLLIEHLALQGIRTYFPTVHVKRVNPRARKIEPYFPGYIFFQADLQRSGFSFFQYMPGAFSLVKFGDDAATVDGHWVQQIQQKIDQIEKTHQTKTPAFHRGDKVVVQSGVFAGYEGIFDCELPGSERVRLLLMWLEKQYVQVEIPVKDVFPQK